MNAPGDFDFYTLLLFLHITSAVIAFGATFAYPVIQVAIQRGDVRALPAWHDAEQAVGRKIVTPGAIVVILTGLYMALDRWDDLGGAWYSAALVIVIVILGLGHGFFVPQSRRMIGAGGGGPHRRRRGDRPDERGLRRDRQTRGARRRAHLAAGAAGAAADGLEAGSLIPRRRIALQEARG